MNCTDHGCGCGCMCHKMPGILLTLIGVTLLAGNMEWIDSHLVAKIWPALLILLGLKKMCGKGMCKCCVGK